MKITANRADLADAAKWVARAIPRSPSSPVLAGVLIKADGGRVSLSAFDQDRALTAAVDVEVGEPGEVVVPGWALASFLGAVRGKTVTMTVGDKAVVTSGSASSTFRTLTDEYPSLPGMGGGLVCQVTGLSASLLRLVNLTARDDTPPIWQHGIQLSGRSGLQVLAGTRYALAAETILAETGEWQALVPGQRLVDAVAGMADDLELHLSADGSLSLVSEGVTGSRSAWLRTYEGAFPTPAEKLLEPSLTPELVVDREELLGSVKLAATASDRVRFAMDAETLTVESWTPERGEAKSDITDVISAIATDPGFIVVAVRIIQSVLESMAGPTVTINYQPNTAKPCTVTDGTTRAAFVPIRVQE